MNTQTRLTKREQQNLANWMSQLATALAQAVKRQDWEAVEHISKALTTEAAGLTHRTMGL